MSTTPPAVPATPNPVQDLLNSIKSVFSGNTTVTINDPLNGTIQSVCTTITATMVFLGTPAGQKLISTSIDDAAVCGAAITKTWNTLISDITALFHKKS